MKHLIILTSMLCIMATAYAKPAGPSWLSEAVIYQIYPSTFMDSDGDGMGDINGIISRLDYVEKLGVNTIWFCPMFKSAWQDGGYDVTDFYSLDPRFGDNRDLQRLVDEAHRRHLRVVLDLVAGHTSDQHPWFKASGQKERNRYTDYYMWTDSIAAEERATIERRHRTHDPAIATWGSYGLANAPRGKYYLKNYFEFQPALNYGYATNDTAAAWQQPADAPGPRAMRRQLMDIMAYWLDMGVDGFRIDMASSLIKNDPDKRANMALWREMRQWIDDNYPERVLIAEWSEPEQSLAAGFHIDFMIHFGLRGFDSLFLPKGTPDSGDYDYCYFDRTGKGTLEKFVNNFTRAYEATREQGYISIPTGNHDIIRPNYGTRNTIEQLKVCMLFHLTMPGVPCIYYGDEIGMKYQPGLPSKEGSNHRSGSRTPMQWTDGMTVGFSTCDPMRLYLPVDTQNGALTVSTQENDENSLLNFTRMLLRLRQAFHALGNDGEWSMLSHVATPYPMVYLRESKAEGERFVVAVNPSEKSVTAHIPAQRIQGLPVVTTGETKYKSGKTEDEITLKPFSAAVFQ